MAKELLPEEVYISKIKFLDNNALKIDYTVRSNIREQDIINKKMFTSTAEADFSFIEILKALKYHIIRDNYIGGVGIGTKDFDSISESDMEALEDYVLDTMTIQEILIKPVINKVGKFTCKIKANLIGVNADVKKIETGALEMFSGGYDYHGELDNSISKLKIKVVRYINEFDLNIRYEE